MALDGIRLRRAHSDDMPFVMSSWFHHNWHGSIFSRFIDKKTYKSGHMSFIHQIQAMPETECLIACYDQDPEIIFGFMIYTKLTDESWVHYLFVKEELRRTGIATSLIAEAEISLNEALCSHYTEDLKSLIHKCPRLRFNPYFSQRMAETITRRVDSDGSEQEEKTKSTHSR